MKKIMDIMHKKAHLYTDINVLFCVKDRKGNRYIICIERKIWGIYNQDMITKDVRCYGTKKEKECRCSIYLGGVFL